MKFQIRFDGPPGPQSGRFIETEDEHGHGIKAGEWVRDTTGTMGESDWLLKIDTGQVELALQGIDPDYEAAQADRQ